MIFGNILGVSSSDLLWIGAVAAAILLIICLLHKELELTSFDPTYAAVIGLRADLLRYLLLVLLALAVVTGIQAVGVVLTSALLVTPAATGNLLSERFLASCCLPSSSRSCRQWSGSTSRTTVRHRRVRPLC